MVLLFAAVFAADLPECGDYDAPDLPTVVVDDACESEPRVGSFDPVVEWTTTEVTFPTYTDTMTSPVVANLTDDNGDGVIDDLDDPDIAYLGYPYRSYTSGGALTVVDGATGAEHWALTSAEGYAWTGSSGVAVGDIDADGSPDICLAGSNAGLICLEADGALKWAAGSASSYGGSYPAIGDMDGDGLAEVVLDQRVYSSTGALLGTCPYSSTFYGTMNVLADMDDDGDLELVTGQAVCEMDGSLLWYDSGPVGYPAVADIDGDGLPDTIRSGDGYIRVYSNGGTHLWSTALPQGGRGGPPTVADFDGDDEPEIGVAGAGAYIVFDTDGSVLWYQFTYDYSSNITGSTVFDFEGDGRAEVVYADELALYVFSGKDGRILLEETGHESGTLLEFPILADVDGDGSTEIVLGSNGWSHNSGNWRGITVVGDANDSWVGSRPIWNQHSYHITNVNDDGSIPAAEVQNWTVFNNFRSGGLQGGPSDWWGDAAVESWSGCTGECISDRAVFLDIPVMNQGKAEIEEVEARLIRYEGGVAVTVASEILSLPSGEATWASFRVEEEDWGDSDLWLLVDPESLVDDCEVDNQALHLGVWPYPPSDGDGDGYDSVECGGTDCDDLDPNVGPGAPEVPGDGVDNDCDPSTSDEEESYDTGDYAVGSCPECDERTVFEQSCGCASGSASGWGVGALLGLLLIRRRG